MYRPPAFREDRPDRLYEAMRAHPLATLVTQGSAGLMANLVPFALQTESGPVLQAHLARGNEQVGQLRQGAPVLVIFQGPQAYVSPGWYATKRVHGRVVPTWNYIVVQARGTPTLIEDADWLRRQIGTLTAAQEQGRAEPWGLDDAPAEFLQGQMKGIIGLEIPIAQIEGKWKVSQNQPLENRLGVEHGLRAEGQAAMADAVAKHAAGD